MDIYAALKKDHQEVKKMLAKLEKNPGDMKTLAELKKEMTIHNRAEEEAFYRKLEDKLGALGFITQTAEEEHEMTDEMILEYEELEDIEERRMLIKLLKKSIECHVDKEEHEYFALAKQHFSAEESGQANTEFKEIKEKLKAGMS